MGIWASLLLDFVTFSILYPTLSLILGKYCLFVNFHNSSVGVSKDSIRPCVLPVAKRASPWTNLELYIVMAIEGGSSTGAT